MGDVDDKSFTELLVLNGRLVLVDMQSSYLFHLFDMVKKECVPHTDRSCLRWKIL